MDLFSESYLAYHKKLNSKLFENNKLRPEVRKALLNNAMAWVKFANIPSKVISDIIFTGGNAQYNYTKYSDLDVHIVVNKKNWSKNPLLDDYLSDKKTLWTLTHKIKVRGYAVEMYAQDINDNLVAAGVYSLLKDEWIKEPIRGHYNFAHDDALNSKVDDLILTIDRMIEDKYPEGEFEIMKDKLKTMRKAALASGDEFSFDNLVFKSLRNSGVVDRMNAYIRDIKDKELSLD